MTGQMSSAAFEIPDMTPALPEIFVLTMACVILVYDLFLSDRNRVITYLMSIGTLAGAAILTYFYHGAHSEHPVVTFSGTFVSDNMADVLKFFVYLITAGVFVYARRYLLDRDLFKGEFYVLGLFGVLGMMVLVSAHNMLSLYLGLELLALSQYALVALQRDSGVASEAAMKYFVLGALASGMLLYGMSMLYGAARSLDIAEIGAFIAQGSNDNLVLIFAVAFIVVGLAFKLGAAPFHMWTTSPKKRGPVLLGQSMTWWYCPWVWLPAGIQKVHVLYQPQPMVLSPQSSPNLPQARPTWKEYLWPERQQVLKTLWTPSQRLGRRLWRLPST